METENETKQLLDLALENAKQLKNLYFVHGLQWTPETIAQVRDYARENGIADEDWLPATYLWLSLNYVMKNSKIKLKISKKLYQDLVTLSKLLDMDPEIWKDNFEMI